MKRLLWAWVIAAIGAVCASDGVAREPVANLPDPLLLESYGLVRNWHCQVPMLARETALSLKYSDGVLFVQTDQGMIHSLDANSGQLKWSVKVNELNREVHPPSVTEDYVYVTTGDDLIQIDRESGRYLWTKTLPHEIVSSPAASKTHVFVHCSDNVVYAVALNDNVPRKYTKRPITWFYNAGGSLVHRPVVHENLVSFVTYDGTLYTSATHERKIFYRFFAYSTVPAPPAYLNKTLYLATGDFNLFAIDMPTGRLKWRFRTGYPIQREPIPYIEDVYFTPEGAGLHCLNNEDGKERWVNPLAKDLLSVSEEHVYATDELSNFLILSRKDGHIEGAIPMPQFRLAAHNQATDRIFVATPGGLVLCMHESKYAQPYEHPQVPAEERPSEPTEQGERPKTNFFGEVVDEPKSDMPDAPEQPAAEEKKPTLKNFFDTP